MSFSFLNVEEESRSEDIWVSHTRCNYSKNLTIDLTKVVMLSSEISNRSLRNQDLSWNSAYIINLLLLSTDTYAVPYYFFPFFPTVTIAIQIWKCHALTNYNKSSEHRHKEKLNSDWQKTKEIFQEIKRIWKRSELLFSPDSIHLCHYKSRTYLYLPVYTTCPSCPPHGDLAPTEVHLTA